MALEARLMTVKEAGEYLRVHQSTVYRLIKGKKLPCFKIGSDYRFSAEGLDRWIREQESAAKG